MPVLELLHTETFDAEMNRLRCECFVGQYPSGDSKDEFDDRSTHVITRVDGALAAYGRLTPGPRSYFESYSGGKAEIPTGSHVADFGRVMVAPSFRGHDHFELILLEGLLWAFDNRFVHVVGSSRPSRGFRTFVHDIGFCDSGPIIQLRQGTRISEPNQPVVAPTAGNRPRWYARKLATLDRLRAKGFDIMDHGCAAKAP